MAYSSYRLKENSTVGRCRRHQRTAIDGRAEKVSAESVRWEGKEEWATIVD